MQKPGAQEVLSLLPGSLKQRTAISNSVTAGFTFQQAVQAFIFHHHKLRSMMLF